MMEMDVALDALDGVKFADEAVVVAGLLAAVPFGSDERRQVVAKAATLVEGARASARKQGVVESFLKEFSLGTREGLALMCLAEALLRTPDAETRDRLIAEKISMADWASHLGKADSLFVKPLGFIPGCRGRPRRSMASNCVSSCPSLAPAQAELKDVGNGS